MGDNVSEPLHRARAGRILPERNVSPYLIVIGGVFRKNSPKVFCVEHDQMIRALAPDRADQAFSISTLPGRAERLGPIPNPHCSQTSLERDAKCSVIVANEIFRCAILGERFGAVGLRVTANHNKRRRSWLRTRNANSC
jgi:hypothetical protein